METLEWANSGLFHENPQKQFGSIFKIEIFSMDIFRNIGLRNFMNRDARLSILRPLNPETVHKV
jgi:hypothetical protein